MCRNRGKHRFNTQVQSPHDPVIYDDGSRMLKRGYTHCEQCYNEQVCVVGLLGSAGVDEEALKALIRAALAFNTSV